MDQKFSNALKVEHSDFQLAPSHISACEGANCTSAGVAGGNLGYEFSLEVPQKIMLHVHLNFGGVCRASKDLIMDDWITENQKERAIICSHDVHLSLIHPFDHNRKCTTGSETIKSVI